MTDMTDWDSDFSTPETMDDEVIELTDIVTEDSVSGEEEEIIELTEIVEPPDASAESAALELESAREPDEPFMGESEDALPQVEPVTAAEHVEQISIRPEELDAALERFIEKRFADRFDTLMTDVINQVIEERIDQVKERLKKALDLTETA
ncbi:MAG: hypothetical protein MI862_01900 [Desulfobacterales bacterium]|nr:hypothetical protein [Desulfobacterales bacterium]